MYLTLRCSKMYRKVSIGIWYIRYLWKIVYQPLGHFLVTYITQEVSVCYRQMLLKLNLTL